LIISKTFNKREAAVAIQRIVRVWISRKRIANARERKKKMIFKGSYRSIHYGLLHIVAFLSHRRVEVVLRTVGHPSCKVLQREFPISHFGVLTEHNYEQEISTKLR